VIRASRPRATPPRSPWSDFPELNLRTYARAAGRPGILFLSLDAPHAVVVAIAQAVFHLPYRRARIRIDGAPERRTVRSRGRADPGAALSARYGPAGPASSPAPGSLDHWLLERYCCYGADRRGGLWRTEIHHPPWSVRAARVEVELNSLTRPFGIPLEGPPAIAHLAGRQDVLFWPPRRVSADQTGDRAHDR
jgi:uncharacterized protein YqjF (DUF2071 family)